MSATRRKKKTLQQLREKSWRSLHCGRCDFCDAQLLDGRIKAWHSSGLLFYLCLSCGSPVLASKMRA
jgi:uncharacterized cysteine cluster protein YcgN (CxxCxxCC family)